MLGLIASALWEIISAGDFAIPRGAWHLAGDALAAAGSA